MMPEIDGVAVIDELRHDPKTASISLIVLTAKALTQQERVQLTAHVQHLLINGQGSLEEFFVHMADLVEQSIVSERGTGGEVKTFSEFGPLCRRV